MSPRYGETLARTRGPHNISLTVGEADLTAAAVTQSINLGNPLPANAIIQSVRCRLATPFTGGSVSNMILAIGTSGDDDAIVSSSSMFAAAVDGQASTLVAGCSPNKRFTTAGAQLLAKFTATGDNVVNCTAGSVIIELDYIVDMG